AENVIFEVALKAELAADVIVKSGGVRRADRGHRRVGVGIRAGGVAVDAEKTAVQAPGRAPLIAEQFLVKLAELDAEIILLDKRLAQTGKAAELVQNILLF